MFDCITSDVPEPLIIMEGEDYILVLPQKYAEIAPVIAKLTSGMPTSCSDADANYQEGVA